MERTDIELKAKLVDAYIRQDQSEEINALKAELYARGFRWVEIVELAIVALMRRYQAAKTPLPRSLN